MTEAMADFYILERLASDGSPLATRMLVKHEQECAQVFMGYMVMVCGGELRLVDEGHEHDAWWCDECHSAEWNEDKGYWDCEGWCSKHRNRYREWHYCDHYYNGESCNWTGFPEPLKDFMNEYTEYGSERERGTLWSHFPRFVEEHGPIAMDWAATAFRRGIWDGACGGEAWEKIARLTYKYMSGQITPRVYVNMGWSIQHNGGLVFNKNSEWGGRTEYHPADNGKPSRSWIYSPLDILFHMLVIQSNDEYDMLALYCSAKVRQMWNDAKYWKKAMLGKQARANPYDEAMGTFTLYNIEDRTPEWLGTNPQPEGRWI